MKQASVEEDVGVSAEVSGKIPVVMVTIQVVAIERRGRARHVPRDSIPSQGPWLPPSSLFEPPPPVHATAFQPCAVRPQPDIGPIRWPQVHFQSALAIILLDWDQRIQLSTMT